MTDSIEISNPKFIFFLEIPFVQALFYYLNGSILILFLLLEKHATIINLLSACVALI